MPSHPRARQGSGSAGERLLADGSVRRVFLIGSMGSGKTTVGRRLSRSIGWPYVDNDRLVEEATGRRAPEIVAEGSEEALHAAEAAALERAFALPEPVIVGVAAWLVTQPDLRARMRAGGLVVWLRAEPDVLLLRAGSGRGRRPEALSLAWISRTEEDRAEAFGEAAHLEIDVGATRPRQVVERIVAALGAPPGSAG